MRFADFETKYVNAQKALLKFEGSRNWPGLTEYDRVYALPVDWQNEDYTAIVRAHSIAYGGHPSAPIAVEVWHWHWRGGESTKLEKLSPAQLAAVAEIKRTARRWVDGEIDELPESTCCHLGEKKAGS